MGRPAVASGSQKFAFFRIFIIPYLVSGHKIQTRGGTQSRADGTDRVGVKTLCNPVRTQKKSEMGNQPHRLRAGLWPTARIALRRQNPPSFEHTDFYF